jgi:hypothetical protein
VPRNGRAQRQVPNFWIGAGWDESQDVTVALGQPAAAMSGTVTETVSITVGMGQPAAAISSEIPTNNTLEIAVEQAVAGMGIDLPYFENNPRKTVSGGEGYDADIRETLAYQGYANRKDPRRAP